MNIFVVGTGRCGTVTFSKACGHITNFTCTHERHANTADYGGLVYPDRHIEVDPHLTFMLASVHRRYPDARWVHMRRRRDEAVTSWIGRIKSRDPRARLPAGDPYARTLFGARIRTNQDKQLRIASRWRWEVMNETISHFLRDKPHITLALHHAQDRWREVWD